MWRTLSRIRRFFLSRAFTSRFLHMLEWNTGNVDLVALAPNWGTGTISNMKLLSQPGSETTILLPTCFPPLT